MATSNKFDLNDPRKIEGYSDDQLYELGKKDAVSVYKRENPDTTLTQEQMIADTKREDVISLWTSGGLEPDLEKFLCQ